MSLNITIARPEHAEALLKLYDQHIKETCHHDPDAAWLEGVKTVLQGQVMGAIYLIGPLSAPVGFASFLFTFDIYLNGLRAELQSIFIRPTLRRRGIAQEAVSKICESFRDHGVMEITCHTTQVQEHWANRLDKMNFQNQNGILWRKGLEL